jgi:hypothetical protein
MIVGAVGFLWSMFLVAGSRERADVGPADEVIRERRY